MVCVRKENPQMLREFKEARRIASVLALTVGVLAAPATAQDAAGNWSEYHGDYRGWRFSPLTDVNKGNVKTLKPVWIHQAGDIKNGLQSTPIAADGIIYYVSGNDHVFALKGDTGEELWSYTPDISDDGVKSYYAGYSRGVAVGHGMVVLGTSDGRLVALDQKTGKPTWESKLTSPRQCNGCNFTSPAVWAGDVLIIGATGGDVAQHGHIFAVTDDGKVLWTFDVLKDDPKSWPSELARKHGGGGAWLPGQYDPTSDTFYIGTSNPGPDFRGQDRQGDNLYTDTFLALDPKTGHIKWHHQENPHDVWDWDSTYESLFVENDGQELITHLNKGGVVFVYDRKTGTLRNTWKLPENLNWVTGVDSKSGELVGRNEPSDDAEKVICPSVVGARSWNAGAYDPLQKLWFTNGYEVCQTIKTAKSDPEKLGYSELNFGLASISTVPPPGKNASAWFGAFDPITGANVWKIPLPNPGFGSVLATAGGLVFNGDPLGVFHAYDSSNGKELWSFNTGAGFRSGPISYKAGGKQYILAPSGFGSQAPPFFTGLFPDLKDAKGGATLIAFAVE
jgi:alcohol dehydrogenase (cytochrome c)